MSDHYITSFIDGRIRVRHPALRMKDHADSLHDLIGSLPGVHKITVNTRIGSLLLEYDPAQVSREELLSLAGQLKDFAPVDPKSHKPRKTLGLTKAQVIRYTNRGMLLSLAASMGFAALGRERGHVIAGGIFLMLNMLHLHTFRRCL